MLARAVPSCEGSQASPGELFIHAAADTLSVMPASEMECARQWAEQIALRIALWGVVYDVMTRTPRALPTFAHEIAFLLLAPGLARRSTPSELCRVR